MYVAGAIYPAKMNDARNSAHRISLGTPDKMNEKIRLATKIVK